MDDFSPLPELPDHAYKPTFESSTWIPPIATLPDESNESYLLNCDGLGLDNNVQSQFGSAQKVQTEPVPKNDVLVLPISNHERLVVSQNKFDQRSSIKGARNEFLNCLLTKCVKVNPRGNHWQKRPRIQGPLKHYLLSFIDFETDLGVSRRVAVSRIVRRIKQKKGLEIDEKVINTLLDNWKRESREKFGVFNDALFEGLEFINFNLIDECFPLLSEGQTVFQLMSSDKNHS